jgi:hypothetical protein
MASGNVEALGVASALGQIRLLREDEGGERESTVRSCIKCGIVEMSGDSAHGFVEDIRSCSKVGSMTLSTILSSRLFCTWWWGYGLLHESKRSGSAPRKLQRPVESISEQDIICRVRLQEPALNNNCHH